MSKRTSDEDFPWRRCQPGEYFFVASVDPYGTIQAGLRAGVHQLGRRAKLRYKVGVYKGLLGVLFTLRGAKRPADRA